MEVLPVDVANLPATLLQTAYPQGFEAFTPPHVDLIALKSLTDTYPLRKDYLKARSSEQSLQTSGLDFILKVFMALASAVGCGRAPAEQTMSVQLPGFKILPKAETDASSQKPCSLPAVQNVEA